MAATKNDLIREGLAELGPTCGYKDLTAWMYKKYRTRCSEPPFYAIRKKLQDSNAATVSNEPELQEDPMMVSIMLVKRLIDSVGKENAKRLIDIL